MKLKVTDALRFCEGNPRLLGQFFEPPITRQAVNNWGEYMPELRVRQLVEKVPALKQYVEGRDGVTPAARAAAAAAAQFPDLAKAGDRG